jgi:spermidine/putrescine transport system substrate-binding protein
MEGLPRVERARRVHAAARRRERRIHVESFQRIDEAIARLAEPDAAFDVFFPTIDVLPDLIAAGTLRPLNHEYLPNVRNLWSWFNAPARPSYDPGLAYTVPYTVYSSGVGWRDDLVAPSDAPDEREPFAVLWDPRYHGRLGIYDDYLEGLSLALLRDGVADLRARPTTSSPAPQTPSTRPSASRPPVHARRRRGRAARGRVRGAPVVVGRRADSAPVRRDRITPAPAPAWLGKLRYRAPAAPGLVVGCDLTAICARGRNPVLAHAFLNHLLDFDTGHGQLLVERLPAAAHRRERRRVRRPDLPLARGRPAEPSERDHLRGRVRRRPDARRVRPVRAGALADQWNRVVPGT